MDIILNDQQQTAIESMTRFISDSDEQFFTLVGPAGTGKTTTIQHWVKTLSDTVKICFTAPTNKAVRVLYKMADDNELSVNCMTIYSLLGLRVTLNKDKEVIKSGGKSHLDKYDVVVIDECSMVNVELLSYIHRAARSTDVKIIFMGDKCQLPPVGEKTSPVFAINNRIELTKVMRQREENPVLGLCTDIRHLIDDGNQAPPVISHAQNADGNRGVHVMSGQLFSQWMPSAFNTENFDNNYDRFRVVAWRNKQVDAYNRQIQALRYPELTTPLAVGEPIVFSSPLHRLSTLQDYDFAKYPAGGWDDIICSTESEGIVTDITPIPALNYTLSGNEVAINRYWVTCRMLSGEEPSVSCVMTDDKDRLKKILDAIANEIKNGGEITWFNFWLLQKYFADVRPAYCMTAHKSQGSTFENVFVDAADILTNPDKEEALRCLYVAVSRASHNVVVNV